MTAITETNAKGITSTQTTNVSVSGSPIRVDGIGQTPLTQEQPAPLRLPLTGQQSPVDHGRADRQVPAARGGPPDPRPARGGFDETRPDRQPQGRPGAARRAGRTPGRFEADNDAGAITGQQLQKATQRVEAELTEVDERLAEGTRRSVSSPNRLADDPGQAFLSAPIDVQRAVLPSVLRVEVLPRLGRGMTWTDERLRLSPVAEGIQTLASA